MAENSKKAQVPDWTGIVRMGLNKILDYWKEDGIKSKEFRLVSVFISFLKSIESEVRKQTTSLGQIRDCLDEIIDYINQELRKDESTISPDEHQVPSVSIETS